MATSGSRSRTNRRRFIALVGVPTVLAGLAAFYRPDRAVRVVTGFVAHNVCSKVFVSGLDPQTMVAETVERSGIRLLRWGLDHRVDQAGQAVDVSLLGLFPSRAKFRDGLGCVLLHGVPPYLPKVDVAALRSPAKPPLLPPIAGPAVVEPVDANLKAALAHAFEEPAEPPYRQTRAVVVLHDGAVIAERYADGIGVDTPLLGYSLTKSMINALLGIMAQQGYITPSFPAPVPQWRAVSDPRHTIEMEHLMRMTSGLALDETNSGFDVSSRMLYLHDDMAAFAVQAKPVAAPGTRWAYSSPTTQILAKIITTLLGGPEQTLRFAWRGLFNPLGMRTVTLEFDGSGALQGTTYMLASARDWGRLGLLYLDDGVIAGQRILHPDWVAFSASATLGSNYGAGFWTNRSDDPLAKERVEAGMPRDAFFASGDLGQRVVILPTQRLVIVRLGNSVDPTGDIRGLERLVREVIAAVPH